MENIYKRMENLLDQDSKSLNHYLAEFTLENFESIPELTLDQFARKANCSKPSIIRFCKVTDCSGFAELKFKIKEYLQNQNDFNFTLNMDYRSAKKDLKYQKIANTTFDEISLTYQKNQNSVDELITKMVSSRLIYIFGTKTSYYFSKNFCNSLRLLGLNVIQENDPEGIENCLNNFQPNDILFCFSLSGTSHWLKRINQKIKKQQNYKMGILGFDSPYKSSFDMVIDVPQFEQEFWNLFSIRAQALTQVLDYLYFDLSKSIFNQSKK